MPNTLMNMPRLFTIRSLKFFRIIFSQKMFRTMFAGSRSWLLESLRHNSNSFSDSFDEDDQEVQTFCTIREDNKGGGTECFKFVALTSEISEHGMREYQMANGQLLLFVKFFGEVHVLQGLCPNCGTKLAQGCLIQQRVLCPRHGSAFDIRTGALERGVGFQSLWVYDSRTFGGNVFAKFPLEKFGRRCELPVMRVCPRRYNYLGIANKPIVIVGAGIAAISCALALREKGYSGRLVIISREHCLPYDRKSLSKRIHEGKVAFDDGADVVDPGEFGLFPDGHSPYDQLSVELMLGVNVREVLPEERTITLEGKSRHKQMEYAYLVLAMGATPRKLAAIKSVELQREVLYMRTLEDAKRMATETAGKSVAIVGAGMLGVELATMLRKMAKSVSLYGKLSSSLAIFGENLRAEILDWLQHNGVNVMRNTTAYDFEQFGQRVQICFNEISTGVGLCSIADKLLCAIGIMPSTSNLMRANIRMDPKGFVLVDERMRTNQPGVLACGDCVSIPLPLIGGGSGGNANANNANASIHQRINWPHWQMAQHQGKLAAQSILGISDAADGHHQQVGGRGGARRHGAVPFLWLDLPDRHLTYSGWPRQQPDEHIQFGSIAQNNYIAYHLKHGNVVAVVNCGPTNLAVQFMDIFARDIKISKDRVLRNQHHNWTNYSAAN